MTYLVYLVARDVRFSFRLEYVEVILNELSLQVEKMDLNRLRWASRRGMLELDLVLSPFVENVYTTLEPENQKRFDALLEAEDTELFHWFLGKGIPDDPDHAEIVKIILSHTGLKVDS